jgi:hypothetical protein
MKKGKDVLRFAQAHNQVVLKSSPESKDQLNEQPANNFASASINSLPESIK